MSLIPPKPLCAGGKRVPALPVSAVPTSPVAGSKSATLQAASRASHVMVRLLFSSAAFIPACGFAVSALMLWVSAMRNCVSNGVRTSRCRADFFRLSKSRCDLPSRRAPDRLAALLTAFRLSIAFCLRRAFTGGSDPACALSRT